MKWGRRPTSVIALLLYLFASAVLLLPGLRGPGYILGNHTPDVLSFIWYLAWWPQAFGHGWNPIFTRAIWWPTGVNLFWTTSIATPALLLSPVTAIFGPVAAYNVAVLLSPVLSAWATFELCREVHGRFWPAIFGGAVAGFSSYEFRQLLNHLHCCMLFPIPLLALLAVRRFTGRSGRWVYIAAGAFFWLLLFGVSTEFFATAVMIGAIYLTVGFLTEPRPEDRRRWAAIARESAAALGISLAFVIATAGPYLWRGYAGGKLWSAGVYSVDPVNLIVPTYTTWLGSALLAPVWHLFAGGRSDAEQGAYLGLPLILIALLAWRRSQGNCRCDHLKIMLTLTMILALGPQLHTLNQKLPLPLPWLVISRIPVIQKALPGRLMFYVTLMLAVLTTGWLATKEVSSFKRIGAALLAVIFLIPNTSGGFWSTRFHTPRIFADASHPTHAAIGHGVLIFPFGYHGWSMLWQVESHFAFSMVDGYTGIAPGGFERNALVQLWLSHGPIPAHYAAQLKVFIAVNHIRTVIAVGPLDARQRRLIAPLGRPKAMVGNTEVFGRIPRWAAFECVSPHRHQLAPAHGR